MPLARCLFALTMLAGCDAAAPNDDPDLSQPGNSDGGQPGDDLAGPRTDLATMQQPPSCAGKLAVARDQDRTLMFGGKSRHFLLHLPASYDPQTPMPLVFNFHGYSLDAAQQQGWSRMNAKADSAGFIAVHADGTGSVRSWNAGVCCGDAATGGVDDVGFVGALLDTLESELCVDARRVYSTGMSNGGFLSHRLACELAGRIAAIAPVSGVNGMASCKPSRPIAVMHFHGTSDTVVPFAGNPNISYIPVQQSIDDWVTRNGCVGAAHQTFMMGDTTCVTHDACPGGVEVTLCTVQGGGHTWPGGTPFPVLGATGTGLSATDAMWSFFQKYAL